MIYGWTQAAIYCFKRRCNCTNCIYSKYITSIECKMKNAVSELLKAKGKPKMKKKPSNILTELEKAILKEIKELETFTLQDIADAFTVDKTTVRNCLNNITNKTPVRLVKTKFRTGNYNYNMYKVKKVSK